MAAKLIELFIKKALFKQGGAMANKKAVEFSAEALEKRLKNLGIDPNKIKDEKELNQILAYAKQAEDQAFTQEFSGMIRKGDLFKKPGEVIPFTQKRTFAEEIEAMKKSGDIVDADDIKISDKIKEREMFKNSFLNKPNKTDEEYKKMFEDQNKKAIKNLKDKMKKDDPEFYTGGMVDVEPNLSDIGHGSDALMARTRLLSPNAQATTSTGLNYLLAEDNDNIRVPFGKGKLVLKKLNEGRRKFMKTAGSGLAGLAALKTGLINLAEEAGPKVEAVKETVSQVPPYFFKLVEKIKSLGDETIASQDKAIAKKYKDYVMEEDFAGNITIIKKNMDEYYPEEVIMNYKVDDVSLPSGKGMAKVDEYEEFTARPDGEGKMKDVEPGVPDEVLEEVGETITKKADGGRIGFGKGKAVLKGIEEFLAGLKINSTTSRFLDKIFGKETMAEMPRKDPDLFKGLLEVTEMYRKRDREGLKKYMKNYLPHMDDVEIEEFIKGNPEIAGISGELVRLGSGRDYAGKLEMMKKLKDSKKLDDLEVTEEMIRKPNASGGLAKLLGE